MPVWNVNVNDFYKLVKAFHSFYHFSIINKLDHHSSILIKIKIKKINQKLKLRISHFFASHLPHRFCFTSFASSSFNREIVRR